MIGDHAFVFQDETYYLINWKRKEVRSDPILLGR